MIVRVEIMTRKQAEAVKKRALDFNCRVQKCWKYGGKYHVTVIGPDIDVQELFIFVYGKLLEKEVNRV